MGEAKAEAKPKASKAAAQLKEQMNRNVEIVAILEAMEGNDPSVRQFLQLSAQIKERLALPE